jgi:hypothetical protein
MTKSFLSIERDLIKLDPVLYTGINIHGVRDENALEGEQFDPEAETLIMIDDDNPQFFSAYLIDKDGMSEVIADASRDKLKDLRQFVTDSAVMYGWKISDYTEGKSIFTCPLCTQKVPTLYGMAHLCLDCHPKAPHIGTKVISLQGETSDTEDGQDVFTGINAEGIVEDILPDQENAFSVVFPNGVCVFLSIQEITDTSRYQLVKKYDVAIYAFVRVDLGGVEAKSQVEAIQIAESRADLHSLIKGDNYHFAEEVDSYIVDEIGDTHFINTGYYNADHSKQVISD